MTKSSKPSRAWVRLDSGRRLDLLEPSPLDPSPPWLADQAIQEPDIQHNVAPTAMRPMYDIQAVNADAPNRTFGLKLSQARMGEADILEPRRKDK